MCAYSRTRLWEGIGGMRREVKYGLIGGSVALVAGVVGGLTLFGGSDESPQEVRSADAKSGDDGTKVATGPLSAKEVQTTSREFLTAWQSGDAAKAAGLTDDPEKCKSALESLGKQARFSKVALTPGTRTGDKVPFSVKATVDVQGHHSKPSGVRQFATVVRDTATGKPQVDWPPRWSTQTSRRATPGHRRVRGPADQGGRPGRRELTAPDTRRWAGAGLAAREVRREGRRQGGRGAVVARGKAAKATTSVPRQDAAGALQGHPGHAEDDDRRRAPGGGRGAGRARRESVGRRRQAEHRRDPGGRNSPRRLQHGVPGLARPGLDDEGHHLVAADREGPRAADKEHPCPKYFTYGGWKFQNDDKFEIKDGTFKRASPAPATPPSSARPGSWRTTT